jgi:hypothetical protein
MANAPPILQEEKRRIRCHFDSYSLYPTTLGSIASIGDAGSNFQERIIGKKRPARFERADAEFWQF